VGAGFLAVDVSDENAVAAFARAFDVRKAPALLVFKRGPEMVTRIDGFADRDTVAQAAGTAQL
jgi:thiol-disulfide isomerase/thioredoxin